MASDMTSILKALLQAQEREMAWDPSSHHGFESSSTYQGELLDGNFNQVDQHGYGERCQAWNMEHHYRATNPSSISKEEEYHNLLELFLEGEGMLTKSMRHHSLDMEYGHKEASSSPISKEDETLNLLKLLLEGQEEQIQCMRHQPLDMEYGHREAYSSPISREDETHHLLKLVLEEQEKFNKSLSMFSADMRDWNQASNVAAPTHEEHAQINDEFLQEAEKIVAEFELLLGCKVDENLVIRYEDSCEDGLGAECMENERMDIQLTLQQETEGTQSKETEDSLVKEASREGETKASPMAQPFDKYLGLLSTHEVSFDDPQKIPFEEIRMKEFRGWFYDEYDPGDTRPYHAPL